MEQAIFHADGEQFRPSELARGPWDPGALHGGAPAALITAAFEAFEAPAELQIARLSFEFLRPVPMAPLSLAVRSVREGRRVQELAGELRCGEQLVCRAGALLVREVPPGLPLSDGAAAPQARAMPGQEAGRAVRFALDERDVTSFAASAMEMRFLGDHAALGPAQVWMHLRHPLVAGRETSALARLAAAADFGNGVGAVLPYEQFVFINADLTIHLHRHPRGTWTGLDARTILDGGGTGLAESVLHDGEGPVGRAFQTLVVAPR